MHQNLQTHQQPSTSLDTYISQNYFKNVLRKKILDICPDFFSNPDKSWLVLTKSHVDETFDIKSN